MWHRLQAFRSHLWTMMAINRQSWEKPVSITPLITFRIAFGLLMFVSTLRFWWRGWVDAVYVSPSFHFTYWGFEWVQPFGRPGMYLLYSIIACTALMIAVGLLYRLATVLFFICFTYVELIDVTTYLNHYYFISLVAFLMIWLPANRLYAIDVLIKPAKRRLLVPAWTIGIIRFQLGVVYFFAGLAKLNPDWLLDAQPMKTWLPAKSHLPIVGALMYKDWVAYLFSWFGALYDLCIVFFLLNRSTRLSAYAFVLIFHISTAIFFPGIGLFPYVMIVSSLIFFSSSFHERLLSFLPGYKASGHIVTAYTFTYKKWLYRIMLVYVGLQCLVPVRFLLYPDHLFWTEEGYRFSWRVMLMEKAGAAYFTVKDKTGKQFYTVNNAEFLTPLQEKMMSTQPDMILRYAHFLADTYAQRGIAQPRVYGEVYVTLNGAGSRLFIDSSVNLAAERFSWKHYPWILPYKAAN
ncbi:HTTM domain-containing protein [Longitalea arenae]|uniref:HTTM domain-containing protein n=1 Tax=Longitalea arenae TaxID=2812558 RepID=UPI0019671FEA|nr:HTTM domain-containing protein [Longitalea arenae]